MENDKECDEILNNIINELEITKEQGIRISEKLNEQTETMSNTCGKLERIENETQVSNWYLNYIKATFGKIYKKCNSFPERYKAHSIGRRLKLKTELILSQKSKDMSIPRQEYVDNTKMSKIQNIISDINYISNFNSNEIDKQNKIIDYNTELAETNEENMFKNRLRIKKILD